MIDEVEVITESSIFKFDKWNLVEGKLVDLQETEFDDLDRKIDVETSKINIGERIEMPRKNPKMSFSLNHIFKLVLLLLLSMERRKLWPLFSSYK